ncbi:hypothetical protein TeGR_g1600, partial [Tetraparma gracilis]
YYEQINDIFGGYADKGNVVQFLVESDQHCYTDNTHIWKADATGSNGGGDGVSMLEWVASLPLEQGGEIGFECEGSEVDDLDDVPKAGTRYCYTKLDNTINA